MNRVLVVGASGNVGRPAHAGLPQQVEVVRGDLTSPETLDVCLDDVDAVFLVWVAPPAAVAPAILRWTLLRTGMLAANARSWWAPQVRAGDVVRWPYLAVPTSPIDERDIAAVAVRA